MKRQEEFFDNRYYREEYEDIFIEGIASTATTPEFNIVQVRDYNKKIKKCDNKNNSISAELIGKTNNVVQANSLPKKGEPNSKETIYNPDGSVKQEREYGQDGQPVKDTDYNHGGVGHKFPHEHEWKDGVRQPGVPIPTPKPNQIQNSSSFEYNITPAAGLAAIGTTIYLIISEGSRIVLPQRNLILIP